jgi:hypothetical protein
VAAAGLAAGGTGCGALLEGLTPHAGVADLGARLARLEAGLEEASRSRLIASLAPEAARSRAPVVRAKLDELEELSRGAMRCLLVAGTVKSLSRDELDDARVSAMLDRVSPEMDEVVGKLTATMANLPDDQRGALQEELRKRPELPMTLAGKLDGRAGAYAVPTGARANLRAAAVDGSFRLRHQPPGILIDEYLAKVERVTAIRAPEATAQRQLAGRVMNETVWRSQRGTTTATVGGYLLLAGVSVFGLSLLGGAATGSIGFAFTATLGALLVLVGLIVGLVGLIMMASSSPEPAPAELLWAT